MNRIEKALNVIRFATARPKGSEEERLERYRDRQQERLQRERAARAARGLQHHVVTTEHRPPAYVLLARAKAREPETLTALLLGDPPPGRSALDRKVQR